MDSPLHLVYFVLSGGQTIELAGAEATAPAHTPPPLTPSAEADAVEDEATHDRLMLRLTASGAAFSTLRHAPCLTSQASADARGVPLASGAKAMLLRAGKQPLAGGREFCLAVLSASARADLGRLKRLLAVKDLSMATPADVRRVTGCLPGAVPPFGSLFDGVLTVCDTSLQSQGDCINFNAGLRTYSVVGLSVLDYLRIEEPVVLAFSG